MKDWALPLLGIIAGLGDFGKYAVVPECFLKTEGFADFTSFVSVVLSGGEVAKR